MTFINRFPLISLSFLGIDCQITAWKALILDFEQNEAIFRAHCTLTSNGNSVSIENAQIGESLNWYITEQNFIVLRNISLSKDNQQMLISFVANLPDVEPLLA
jgi:DNA-binding GntR family transcriptional regulator